MIEHYPYDANKLYGLHKALSLGPELVTGTDSDMSGANNWINDNAATFDINTTVAGKLYILGDGTHDYGHLTGTLPTAGIYTVTLKARLNAGSGTFKLGLDFAISTKFIQFTPTGTETILSGEFVNTQINAAVFLGGWNEELNGSAIEIDDISIREKLTSKRIIL